MRKIFFTLFLILIFQSFSFSQILISLKESAEVNTEYIYLKDIAKIYAYQPFKEKLENLKIYRAAPPGNSCILNWQFIKGKICKDFKEIVLLGAKNVRVRTKAKILTGEEITKKLFEKINFQNENMKIEVLTPPKDLILKDAPFTINFNFENLKKGFNSIPVEIEQEGKIVKRLRINLKVRVFREVFVANKNIKKGEKISENLKKELREVTNIPDVAEETDMNNKVAAHFLKEGKIISKNDLEEEPAILKNSPVEIVLKEGAIFITTSGIALNSGKIGEKIQVLAFINKKIFSAKVLDKNKVEIIN